MNIDEINVKCLIVSKGTKFTGQINIRVNDTAQ